MYLRDTFLMDALGSLPGLQLRAPCPRSQSVFFACPRSLFLSDPRLFIVHVNPLSQCILKLSLLSNIAVQYLDCIPNTSAGQIKLLRLLRMIKLLRLNRLQQVFLSRSGARALPPLFSPYLPFRSLGLPFLLLHPFTVPYRCPLTSPIRLLPLCACSFAIRQTSLQQACTCFSDIISTNIHEQR